jgi:hypothetical protein
MIKFKISTTPSSNKEIKYLQGILFGLIIGTAIYFYGGSIAGNDTFIYMRYVNNINNGDGFCYNLYEKSYGTTSILWSLFMVPITKIFGNQIEIWKLTTCFLAILKSVIVFLFLISLDLNIIKSSFLTVFSFLDPHTFRWLSSGMENSIAIFFLTLIAIIYYKYTNEKSTSPITVLLLGLLVGILPFFRPEFALYSSGIIITEVLKKRHKSFSLLIPAALSFLICLALTYMITGFLIPRTAEAKAISLFNGHVYAFSQTLKIILSGALGAIILLLLLRKYGLASKNWNRITIISLLVTVIYLVTIGQLISTRYAIFLCSPIILASTITLADLLKNRIGNKIKSLIALQICIFITVLIYVFPSTRLSEENDIRIMADYSRNNIHGNLRVALTEIGAYGYYSNLYIVDLVGLVDLGTFAWLKRYGRPQNLSELEDLLIFRKATHYINCFSENEKLKGEKLNFSLLKTVEVVRNNLSYGTPLKSYWRLYSINLRRVVNQ